MIKPKYPIYIISKGRADKCLTANFLIKDNVDFKLVVEPQEAEKYSSKYGKERILVLPFNNLGQGSIPARNWVWEHAKKTGIKRHWILDDNIRLIRRLYKGKRIPCNSNIAFSVVEDFADRYENIAIIGLNYTMFVKPFTTKKPFYLNAHVYSCILILNELPNRWRGRYNEDTDLCLQVLADGWCTVLINTFMCDKIATMKMKGGNTDELYKNHGRLDMAKSLERAWPYVVETKRKFKRPQHHIKFNWKKFDTPLKRRKDIDFDSLTNDKYNINLIEVKEIKDTELKKLKKEYKNINNKKLE